MERWERSYSITKSLSHLVPNGFFQNKGNKTSKLCNANWHPLLDRRCPLLHISKWDQCLHQLQFQVFLPMHLMANISSSLLKLVQSITGNHRLESGGQWLLPQWVFVSRGAGQVWWQEDGEKPSRSVGLGRALWAVPPVPAVVTHCWGEQHTWGHVFVLIPVPWDGSCWLGSATRARCFLVTHVSWSCRWGTRAFPVSHPFSVIMIWHQEHVQCVLCSWPGFCHTLIHFGEDSSEMLLCS